MLGAGNSQSDLASSPVGGLLAPHTQTQVCGVFYLSIYLLFVLFCGPFCLIFFFLNVLLPSFSNALCQRRRRHPLYLRGGTDNDTGSFYAHILM